MAERLTVAVTGARDWPDPKIVAALLTGLYEERVGRLMLFVGDCPTGTDLHARQWAHRGAGGRAGLRIFEARWDEMAAEGKPRRAAGPLRNTEMLDALAACEGDRLVVAFHDDLESSKGTLNCVRQAQARGLPVYLVSRL